MSATELPTGTTGATDDQINAAVRRLLARSVLPRPQRYAQEFGMVIRIAGVLVRPDERIVNSADLRRLLDYVYDGGEYPAAAIGSLEALESGR